MKSIICLSLAFLHLTLFGQIQQSKFILKMQPFQWVVPNAGLSLASEIYLHPHWSLQPSFVQYLYIAQKQSAYGTQQKFDFQKPNIKLGVETRYYAKPSNYGFYLAMGIYSQTLTYNMHKANVCLNIEIDSSKGCNCVLYGDDKYQKKTTLTGLSTKAGYHWAKWKRITLDMYAGWSLANRNTTVSNQRETTCFACGTYDVGNFWRWIAVNSIDDQNEGIITLPSGGFWVGYKF